jgi:hypothetical protein
LLRPETSSQSEVSRKLCQCREKLADNSDHGTTVRSLFAAFYGEDHDLDNAGWREMAEFSSCDLRPLEWAGLLTETREVRESKHVHHAFKMPLWRRAIRLDTDGILQSVKVRWAICAFCPLRTFKPSGV